MGKGTMTSTYFFMAAKLQKINEFSKYPHLFAEKINTTQTGLLSIVIRINIYRNPIYY